MTINAVQQYVYEAINGTQPVVYYTAPLEAYVRPLTPDVLSATAPQVFIWGAQGTETRYTPPRKTVPALGPQNAGYRQAIYKLRMWVVGVSENITQAETLSTPPERAFPAIVWQVMDILRSVEMPVQITDPDTAEQSFITLIGEQFDWDYDEDRTLSDQAYIRSLALLECSITEMWQE
jgi:hypothetical protein